MVRETRQTLNTAYTTKWQFHRQTHQVTQLFRIDVSNTTDHDKLTALVQSETRIMQLQNKLDTLCGMAQETLDSNVNNEDEQGTVHAMGDVNKEDFKIEQGTNDSLCTWEPFAEGRIQEILAKIEIGEDLSEEQKGHVKSLIREYADVFTLSLSKVQFVDWYTHKLHIEPGEMKFPTRVNQHPVTEVQKKWFNKILDGMEAAHVIQRVPGDFVKNLSSTNLAPKEAGKTGLTRTKVPRQVNAECICNNLPPFWEEVMLPGETNEALLEAVDNTPAGEKETKWRVCHAFNALNKVTQVPPFPAGNLKAKHEFASGHR